MFWKMVKVTVLSILIMGCSDEPNYVSRASMDISAAIHENISGCDLKTYHKDDNWFVLCYVGSPQNGGALYRIDEDKDDSNGDHLDYFVVPITGKARQYSSMKEFHKNGIPVKDISYSDSANIMNKYFSTFD